jgi:ferrous iron transport protein A
VKADTQSSVVPLTAANENTPVRVVAVRGGAGFARRLAEMGIAVGCEITVWHRQRSGLVVMRGETRFALGSGMAHRILVCTI